MASFTYDDFRTVLKKAGFEKVRSEKHETWRKVLLTGSILRVRISHQHKRDIPQVAFPRNVETSGIYGRGI